jgi:hypothetical protein
MINVRNVFDEFQQRLELTEAERSTVSRQQNDLRDRICSKLGGVERGCRSRSTRSSRTTFGSWARFTSTIK